jgi:predicted Zn-dependent peptidase
MKEQAEFSIFTLSSGLRVVHRQTDRPVAHLAVMINAGTRDEQAGEEGLAHFIEHALFKGTKNRRAYHILNRMDSVGGEMDAYTTKEITCLYSSFLKEHYPRAAELLSDILLNSTFPEKELEKEKEVVLDEIKVYQDSPADQIYDDFEAQVFKNHPLGNSILGTERSVREFTPEHLFNFTHRLYRQENLVLSSVGNISVPRLKRLLEKYFATIEAGQVTSPPPRTTFKANGIRRNRIERETFQSHCMMGKATYGAEHANRLGMVLLNNILGGPAMNSILNLQIREKYGFTYNIESNYAIYSDIGLFSVYLGTDPKYAGKCMLLVEKELKKLRDKPLSKTKFQQARQQLKGQLALSRESNTGIMLSNAKNLLVRGEIQTIGQILKKIDQLDASLIQEIAREELNPGEFHHLIFQGKTA